MASNLIPSGSSSSLFMSGSLGKTTLPSSRSPPSPSTSVQPAPARRSRTEVQRAAAVPCWTQVVSQKEKCWARPLPWTHGGSPPACISVW
jgi:hypothetical protein